MTLSSLDLREANIRRLPLFKNGKGKPAHSEPDGSDWTTSQWFQATVGEMGEFIEAIWTGSTEDSANELADVQIYLDLLAYRLKEELPVLARYVGLQGAVYGCLGVRSLSGWDIFNLPEKSAQMIPEIICQNLGIKGDFIASPDLMYIVAGNYANTKKKFDRGDLGIEEFVPAAEKLLGLWQLAICSVAYDYEIDLGAAVVSKFNRVSERIGCEVLL